MLIRTLVLALALSVAGCQYFSPLGPIISIGTFWVQGEAHKYYHVDQKTLLAAAKAALKELGLKVTEETVKGDAVHLTAGDQKRFHVKVVSVRPQTARLDIRVNVFGDKAYAELVYQTVDRHKDIKVFATAAELNEAVK